MSMLLDIPVWVKRMSSHPKMAYIVNTENPEFSLSIVPRTLWGGTEEFSFRLFLGETLIGAAKALGPGNMYVKDASLLDFIEINPAYRGHKYACVLMRMMQDYLGVIYRTGSFSQSGFANAKHMPLPLVPGNKVSIEDVVEYEFVDWENGWF